VLYDLTTITGMDGRVAMRPSRPQSVSELVAQAESFSFNNNIPLRHWTRAAETLYQEASFALSEGDYARAYVMLYRHSVLVLHWLPQHPQYKDPEQRKACRALSRRIGQVMDDLEQLKPELEKARREWERMRPAPEPSRKSPEVTSRYADFAARDPTLTGNAKILDAGEHQELAVDLAQRELLRRDTARRASRRAGIPEEESLLRRRAGRWEEWRQPTSSTTDNDLQWQMAAARRQLDTPSSEGQHGAVLHGDTDTAFVSQNYNYPSISKSRPVDYERAPSQQSLPSPLQPSLPPKEPAINNLDSMGSLSKPPPPPRKVALQEYQALVPSLPPRPSDGLGPTLPPKTTIEPPRPAKKERLAFKPGAYLENGDPIRSIFLPGGLREKFLSLAAENTRAGLEMCGILCGTPVNNALFIRCLVIPDQKCTSDTCETQNEGALFDFCDKEDLLMVGWIHTHPTQTCFMSSRDLHTHAGYQIMMPESIAIVCAPKFEPSYGIFRLTNPPGLEHILNCTHSDTFHQHSIDNLYRGAMQPEGHVYESNKLSFDVQDLRGM